MKTLTQSKTIFEFSIMKQIDETPLRILRRTLFARTTTSPDFTARTGDSTMLVPVTTSVWGMEYSVHACPKKHRAEAEAMFPGLDVSDLLVIPTCQASFRNRPQP